MGLIRRIIKTGLYVFLIIVLKLSLLGLKVWFNFRCKSLLIVVKCRVYFLDLTRLNLRWFNFMYGKGWLNDLEIRIERLEPFCRVLIDKIFLILYVRMGIFSLLLWLKKPLLILDLDSDIIERVISTGKLVHFSGQCQSRYLFANH
jgi:hypothetical protein